MDLANWSYISGLVTVLADRLIDRRTLLGLLDAADAEERRGRLRASLLYEEALPGEHPAEEIESRFAETITRLAEQAPDKGIARPFLLDGEWAAFRRFAKRELTARPRTETAADGTEADPRQELYRALLRGDVPSPEWRRFAEAAAAMAGRLKSDDPLGEMDRVADAAEAASMLDAARALESEPLAEWTAAWMDLRAAAGLLRARRNGWNAEERLNDWSAFGFDSPALRDLARDEESAWPGALVRLGLGPADAARAAKGPSGVLASRVDDFMTERLRDVSGTPFGPERVFAFFWALRVEATNLRVILSAAESGMARERVEAELRTGW
jgi:vacuolar-type H+-ATPase subunit C/Vma6